MPAGESRVPSVLPGPHRRAYKRPYRVAFVLLAAALAFGAPARNLSSNAFAFPIFLGNPQDIAVRAALSEFGKAIGDQLPVVVSPTDALPTAVLPGPPFSPTAGVDVTAALRRSSDGTVVLAPGDYEFTVDVFCMQAHAGSPLGHRYVVAPLRGSAASVFVALNSRAPSFPIDHHALQVLSWDIQAGLPYSAMRVAQRAIVDRVIPDYRQQLSGDVYERIRSRYEQIAGRVPGMPSFEEALNRIGPVGQAVVRLQTLRQEMAQPPPTFQELVRELIPVIPLERGGSGPTPWSRYSDRVFVRFVTSGNYATPGTYQVRVLPAQISMRGKGAAPDPADPGAPVPFTNIINNPGTPAVQPLTLAPQPGGTASQTQPHASPTPAASITSETYATEPEPRSRTTIGVGELVRLTFSGDEAQWSISGGDGTLTSNTGKTTTFVASMKPGMVTVTATSPTGTTADITFSVIAPSLVWYEIVPGKEVHHHQGWPDIGFSARMYLRPETVSFANIVVREGDAQFLATGYYARENGMSHLCPGEQLQPHCQGPEAVQPSNLVPGKGWLISPDDDVWSGRWADTRPPWAPGHETVYIPWEYAALEDKDSGPFYVFWHVTQNCELMKDGSTLIAEKGNASLTLHVSDPDY